MPGCDQYTNVDEYISRELAAVIICTSGTHETMLYWTQLLWLGFSQSA